MLKPAQASTQSPRRLLLAVSWELLTAIQIRQSLALDLRTYRMLARGMACSRLRQVRQGSFRWPNSLRVPSTSMHFPPSAAYALTASWLRLALRHLLAHNSRTSCLATSILASTWLLLRLRLTSVREPRPPTLTLLQTQVALQPTSL